MALRADISDDDVVEAMERLEVQTGREEFNKYEILGMLIWMEKEKPWWKRLFQDTMETWLFQPLLEGIANRRLSGRLDATDDERGFRTRLWVYAIRGHRTEHTPNPDKDGLPWRVRGSITVGIATPGGSEKQELDSRINRSSK